MLDQLLKERYQVVQVLSQGVFCQTYTARDITLPDYGICIVKHFLPSRGCQIPLEIRRRLFYREAEALRKLGDYDLVPHLLAYFEDNLEFYLVQEFIEGHPLNLELPPGFRWSESNVIQLLQEILSILNFVHNQGLIHRDVKPSNILRRKQDNRLVLIDFGAVKPTWSQLTTGKGKIAGYNPSDFHTTISIGTPGYMPNEQMRGKPRPSSDIYALGMIAIQALTGLHPTQLPEDQNSGEVIWQDMAYVSAGLASVLNRMVHYHFQDRFKSAKEVLDALQTLTNTDQLTQASDPTLVPEKTLINSSVSFEQDTNTLSMPRSNQTKIPSLHRMNGNPMVPSFSPQSILLIGLVTGVVSGLILMFMSYWSLQMIDDASKVQNSEIQQLK
jgi:serine/threonine protein kinase